MTSNASCKTEPYRTISTGLLENPVETTYSLNIIIIFISSIYSLKGMCVVFNVKQRLN